MREVYNDTSLPQETRNISNKQSNLTSKGARKRTIKSQRQQKERNHKRQSEINEIETKNKPEKMNETKSWFLENFNKINKPLARLIKRKKRDGPNQ